MDRLTVGETIVLEDEKEFACFAKIQDEGKDYVFLMSNEKPLKVFFAEEILDGDVLSLRKIKDPEEKRRLMQLFGNIYSPAEDQTPPKDPEPTKTLNGESAGEGISVGETVELENGKKYFCFRKIQYNGAEYLCFGSQSDLREIVFAQETIDNGVLAVSIVKDPEKYEQLLKLTRKNLWEGIKKIFQKKPKEKKTGDEPKKKSWWQR